MSSETLPPPGCLVVLVALSDGMAAEAPTRMGEYPMAVAARYYTDELIEGLVNAAATHPIRLDIAVLGYHASQDGGLQLVPLLANSNPNSRLTALSDLSQMTVEPRSEGRPRRWSVPCKGGGTAPAAAALAFVYALLGRWLVTNPVARPPLVIHHTAGENLDIEYERVARSLTLLTTATGAVRLAHCGYMANAVSVAPSAWVTLPDDRWAAVREVSSLVPVEANASSEVRAISLNDWPMAEVWSLLFQDSLPAADTLADSSASVHCFEPLQSLWRQKLDSAATEWEDAFAIDAASGIAVVGDGASEGIFCRIWADLLTRQYIADRPEVRSPELFSKWIFTNRTRWREAIDYPKLRYSQQNKVSSTGAAATLLGVTVAPAASDGEKTWQAAAVGDACMFWARGDKLLATFPLAAVDQLGSTPALLRTMPGPSPAPLLARGQFQAGDLIVIATDAVSGWLFRQAADDWNRFANLDPVAWSEEIDQIRRDGRMVNDDCTLVILRMVDRPVSRNTETRVLTIPEPPGTDEPLAPTVKSEPQ